MKGKRGEWPDSADTKAAEGETKPAPGETIAPAGDKPTADTTVKTYERVTSTESIKHTFTTPELFELADKMGAAASRVFRIETEKSEQAAHYGALLKEANRALAELVERFNLRYEMRDVECKVEFDKPEPGYKSFISIETGESVREVRMTEAEKQRAFVFDAGDGKPQ